jgi:phosphopantothenoylcysteine synthetase/decarboxylase
LQAQKAARELELKEREIDIKEQEQRLRAEEMRLKEQEQTAKLAEIGFKIMGEQAEAKDAEEGHNAAMEMANQVAEAVKGLQASMDSNASDRQKALEELSKPRTVTRDEQGNITGVE